MRTHLFSLLLSICLSGFSSPFQSASVAGVDDAGVCQWPVSEGGNGHYYSVVHSDDVLTWTEARLGDDFVGAPGNYLGMWIAPGFEGLWIDDVRGSINTEGWFVVEWDTDLETHFIRGDSNGDGVVSSSDLTFLFNWMFRGGEEFPCPDAADTDDSGEIGFSDLTTELQLLYGRGVYLPQPYPYCGADPTPDRLRCSLYKEQSDGRVVVTFPDVCQTPAPAGPIPIPYPNTARSSDRCRGSKKVRLHQTKCKDGFKASVISVLATCPDGTEKWVEESVVLMPQVCD